jgi:hypothetical protein
MGTGGSFPGLKRKGREADHWPSTSAEVTKMWICTSTPPYAFTLSYLLPYWYCWITKMLGKIWRSFWTRYLDFSIWMVEQNIPLTHIFVNFIAVDRYRFEFDAVQPHTKGPLLCRYTDADITYTESGVSRKWLVRVLQKEIIKKFRFDKSTIFPTGVWRLNTSFG